MGWFRDWLHAQSAASELERRLEAIGHDIDTLRAERDEAQRENRHLRERVEQAEAAQANASTLAAQYLAEKRLLVRMLEDAHEDIAELKALRSTNVVLERHNAAHQASNEWAVAHINMLTAERAALLSQRAPVELPVPEMQYRAPAPRASRGAPAQPFDTVFDAPPPPGPIAGAPQVAGVPIPDGKTAGDVLERLRAERDDTRAQGNLTPEELLKAGADLFDDLPFPGDTPSGPFAE